MATYCRHPYIQLCARSSVSLRSGGSILQSKAGPFLASGEGVRFLWDYLPVSKEWQAWVGKYSFVFQSHSNRNS